MHIIFLYLDACVMVQACSLAFAEQELFKTFCIFPVILENGLSPCTAVSELFRDYQDVKEHPSQDNIECAKPIYKHQSTPP